MYPMRVVWPTAAPISKAKKHTMLQMRAISTLSRKELETRFARLNDGPMLRYGKKERRPDKFDAPMLSENYDLRDG